MGTLSKAVIPDPTSLPAASGLAPRPLPSAGPTFADLPPCAPPLSVMKSRLQPQQPSLSAPSHSALPGAFLLPRRTQSAPYSFLGGRPSNLLPFLCFTRFPPLRRHPFWLLRF